MAVTLLLTLAMSFAADPATEKYAAYWLTRHPKPVNNPQYEPILLLVRGPLERLVDVNLLIPKNRGDIPLLEYLALRMETYQKDSVWNIDLKPIKPAGPFGRPDRDAKEITVDGVNYRYEACPLKDALRLFEKPEGTISIHRIHGPFSGQDQTAKALKLLLKEQLGLEDSKKKD